MIYTPIENQVLKHDLEVRDDVHPTSSGYLLYARYVNKLIVDNKKILYFLKKWKANPYSKKALIKALKKSL